MINFSQGKPPGLKSNHPPKIHSVRQSMLEETLVEVPPNTWTLHDICMYTVRIYCIHNRYILYFFLIYLYLYVIIRMQHCIVYNSIISFPFTTYNWSSTEKWSPQWLFKEGLGESGCCIFLRPPLETSAKTPRHWEVLKDPGILRYLQEARFWILE